MSLENPTYRQTAKPRLYRVSSAGQISFPPAVSQRWGMESGGSAQVFDIDDAIMLMPEQLEELPDTIRSLGLYGISSVNQFSIPAEIRKRWGTPRVEFVDLCESVLYLKPGTSTNIIKALLPNDDFLTGTSS